MGKSGTVVSIVTEKERPIVEKFVAGLGVELRRKTMYAGQILDWTNAGRPRERAETPGGKEASARLSEPVRPNPPSAAAGAKPARTLKKSDHDRKNKGAPKWLKEKRQT